jgi:hypothetical protein
MLCGSQKRKVRRRVYVQMIVVFICHDRYPQKGLSPCQRTFDLSKSSFYDQIPRQSGPQRSRHASMSFADCRRQEHAVAWREAQKNRNPPPPCIMPLPKGGDHAMDDKLGYCYGYQTYRYKLWYIGQGTCSWVYNYTHLTPNSSRSKLSGVRNFPPITR